MSDKAIRAGCFVAFSVCILVVLRLTVFRSSFFDERHLNLELFADLVQVYQNVGLRRFLWLFFGNIGWFIPFGFLLPALLKRESFLKVVAIGFAFSFAIEASQFVFRVGVAELDDLILNTVGVAIGYFLYRKSLAKVAAARD